ncbi:RIP metalloprotease RseP [Thiomicrorhabdus sediminis]|uniref:Zinc metalloprotease n=1 Tax=Thiomicrorhabdus sediminis TaxID=2580412 RepID=A0A4P9K6V5_9GAMM|nr:RIP metalloprotease RseP [Thiomicrorhabdus sediminis]QCU90190.1 RIP metalloprotease RseP [Thiomicrorhabdus sediminis]
MDIFWSVLGFVVVMAIIVTIHEWGHYQVGRWFNVKVLRFSVGFGKPIYSWQRGETEFVIAQIPLGGYVKFADEREAPVAAEDLARAFNRQNVYKRIAIVAAGPLINLLLAWWVFAAMFMIGVSGFKPLIASVDEQTPLALSVADAGYSIERFNLLAQANQPWQLVTVNQQDTQSWQQVQQQLLQALALNQKTVTVTLQNDLPDSLITLQLPLAKLDINQPKQNWLSILGFKPARPDMPAVVDQVVSDGPAAKAGVQSGDKILAIDEKPVSSWQDFVKVVQSSANSLITLSVLRDGVELEKKLIVGSKSLPDGKRIGVIGLGVYVDPLVLQEYSTVIRFGFLDALDKGYQRSVELVQMSLVMIQRMLIGEVSTDNLSGPISIAQFSGQALQSGLISFLSLLGLLSLSIGILNLLPIPMLDGGHLVYYFIEIIKGSPVSERFMIVGQMIGMALIAGLTLLALFNDFIRISHG